MFSLNQDTNDKYLMLFASCLITKGHGRALLTDSQRGKFDLIPNDMINFMENAKLYSIKTLFKIYGVENKGIVESYVSYILENEYGFLANDKIRTNFPEIKIDWKNPSIITNSIIDIKDFEVTKAIYERTISQLNELQCEAVQIRSYISLSIEQLEYLANSVKLTCIEYLEIYVKDSDELPLNALIKLMHNHTKISNIIVHAADKNDEYDVIKSLSSIYHTTQVLTDETCCGLVEKQYFNAVKSHYMEAHFHNTCLNRKVSIDANGSIKNCPSMATSFGNIKETNLSEVIKNEEFTSIWNLKKDFVLVCQDCEFRYVCTDCRAYTEEPANLYSKPLKCGYDPYTNEWSDWEENPLKQKAIAHYELSNIKRTKTPETKNITHAQK
ncbi:grasp-with-spasm system SPASM domain peptide maturase [Kordia sp. YSTF-M3]|uniref:Grasp-with-spasm system SPASM domain peptide maturase n=1 Tax=Kordia aestuariivivens TaxID=2759037 RepID=A0ABR7Q5N5_9FLAO|nr:grasp-with-spasm system SPASM domain peptide maturase [Kordia aestuariivivens]MBC8753773.1 grasp-with-spasm system SPASM domain peptide maturase [Kordia aestuariivivens]